MNRCKLMTPPNSLVIGSNIKYAVQKQQQQQFTYSHLHTPTHYVQFGKIDHL